MMQYFCRHYGTLEEVEQHLHRINCDLLEVYCSPNSELTNHDISTAFLRGSKQDSRILGIEPPAEMRRRLGLREEEACEL